MISLIPLKWMIISARVKKTSDIFPWKFCFIPTYSSFWAHALFPCHLNASMLHAVASCGWNILVCFAFAYSFALHTDVTYLPSHCLHRPLALPTFPMRFNRVPREMLCLVWASPFLFQSACCADNPEDLFWQKMRTLWHQVQNLALGWNSCALPCLLFWVPNFLSFPFSSLEVFDAQKIQTVRFGLLHLFFLLLNLPYHSLPGLFLTISFKLNYTANSAKENMLNTGLQLLKLK